MKYLTAQQVQEKIENNESLNIIDVRETSEVARGKIPTAINIPLGLLEFRKQELDKGKEYILVCHSGGRSYQAAQYLESNGFNVTNMEGGMMSWGGKIEF